MPIPLIDRASLHAGRTAVVDGAGEHLYDELLEVSGRVARRLLAGRSDLGEERVAFLVPSSFTYPAVQWGIWRAGGIAVPLCALHPRPELAYAVTDADASIVIGDAACEERLRPVAEEAGRQWIAAEELAGPADEAAATASLPAIDASRRAMIVYTSGTTGRPKGAVTTHANLAAQIASLVEAWEWNADDRILLVLPLHHVHGIVNVLGCALWSGAACEMLPRFDAVETWQRLRQSPLTLFMAVPTIYRRLIAAWEEADPRQRSALSRACRGFRVMISGSAALPVETLERWRQISGHTLLERYGMTEIGMALANPLRGERRPGWVGGPLPGVEVRRLDEAGRPAAPATPAELEVRGPGVFLEYWRRPRATAEAFRDGWFRTGDVAIEEDGAYRLLGRQSVDILKTGGYKVSALEIEEVLRGHPAIRECAVVGLPDPEWGERVAAVVETAGEAAIELEELRAWAKQRLAAYKVPSLLFVVDALPRNALGKVTKPELRDRFAR